MEVDIYTTRKIRESTLNADDNNTCYFHFRYTIADPNSLIHP
jgi:hypothetical protein